MYDEWTDPEPWRDVNHMGTRYAIRMQSPAPHHVVFEPRSREDYEAELRGEAWWMRTDPPTMTQKP